MAFGIQIDDYFDSTLPPKLTAWNLHSEKMEKRLVIDVSCERNDWSSSVNADIFAEMLIQKNGELSKLSRAEIITAKCSLRQAEMK